MNLHTFNKLLTLFILLILYLTLSAQKFNFRNYTVINGLGSSSINHIFQDSKGYIWFATQGGGASRFNGSEFRNFTKADGLVSNDVTFITEDKKGNIWIATATGASEFDGLKFTAYRYKEGLSDGVIYSIYVDDANKIWFALKDGGIKIFNGHGFDSLTVNNGLPSNDVYSINRDRKGNYWFGLANGIAKYGNRTTDDPDSYREQTTERQTGIGTTIKTFNNLDFIKDKTFFSTCLDTKGNIWFGSASGDVVIIDPNEKITSLALPKALNKAFIGDISEDKNGIIWLATDQGVLKYHDNQFSLFTEKQGLSVNTAQSLICDYEGNIWIGTLTGGVNLLTSEAFAAFTQSDGLKINNVTCIYQDTSSGMYFIGTGGAGLYVHQPGAALAFKPVNSINDLNNLNISSISAGPGNTLWVSAQEGLFVLEKCNDTKFCVATGSNFRLKNKYQKIAGQILTTPLQIIYDGRGNMWLATFGSGLFEISGAKEKCYSKATGFQSDNILSLFKDNRNNIWIGTGDAGVIKYDGKMYANFEPAGGFPAKAVWSITGDNKGNIYFGTGENGLYCFNGNKLYKYTTTDGLCSNYIPALQWDGTENCLWLGGEKGLNKIKFDNNHAIASIHTYNEAEGYNAWGINQNSILADNNGRVWFGSVNGLWRYDRQYDYPKSVPPKIQLTGIRLAYQKADWKKYSDSIDNRTGLPFNLALSYKNNHLTFDVRALTTGDVHYTYQLEGQDENWSPLTKNTEADYSNISPGKKYVFRAKAVNSSGINSVETIEFPFTIYPPWWNTWWFRLTVAIIFFAALAAVIKTRENVLRGQNLKLEKTVQERTAELETKNVALEKLNIEKNNFLSIVAHDLKNPLGIVRTFAEISADRTTSADKREHYLQNIAITTERMYELVNNLLDINSIESGKLNLHFAPVDLRTLTEEMITQVEPVAGKREIRIVSALPKGPVELHSDKARCSQVLENYISNALKYSPSDTTVYVELVDAADYVEIKVKDEGPGIDIQEQANLFTAYGVASSVPFFGENKTGLGLAIVKKIADELHAEVGCVSAKGEGSTFYIRFLKR